MIKKMLSIVVIAAISASVYQLNTQRLESGTRNTPHENWSDLSNAELQEIISDSDLESAIYSAWEQSWREVTKKNFEQSDAIDRFVELLARRLEVAVPELWSSSIKRFEYGEEELVLAPAVPDSSFSMSGSGHDFLVSRTCDLQVEDSKWFVQFDDLSINPVPLVNLNAKTRRFLTPEAEEAFEHVAISPDQNGGAILAFALLAPNQFPLVRLDHQGNVLWISQVHCCAKGTLRVLYDGILRQVVEIACNKDNLVVVFGIANDVIFIEGFKVLNGDPVFRFSTKNWEAAR